MKRVGAILLLTMFVAATLGVCVHQHFCGNNLKGVQLFVETTEEGCCGADEEESDCCTDVEQIYQLDTDFSINKTTKIIPHVPLVHVLVSFVLPLKNEKAINYHCYHPPNRLVDIPILFQSFLI